MRITQKQVTGATVVSGVVSLDDQDRIYADTVLGSVQVTLPQNANVGDLVRVYIDAATTAVNFVSVDPGAATIDGGGIVTFTNGDKPVADFVLIEPSSWRMLASSKEGGFPDVQVFTSSDSNVYADSSIPPLRDPANISGWNFTNAVAGQKINWYTYAAPLSQTYESIKGAWAIIQFNNTTSHPFVAVYSKPLGDGNDAAPWYRSRWIWSTYTQPAAVGPYLVYFGEDPGIRPELPRVQITGLSGLSAGPQLGTEDILTIAWNSNSASAVGAENFTIVSTGVTVGTKTVLTPLVWTPAAVAITSDTVPPVADYDNGQLWWDSANLELYVLHDDGTTKAWVNVTIAAAVRNLDDLADVNTTNIASTDGDIIAWDAATSQWLRKPHSFNTSDTQVLFNNNGVIDGDAGLRYDISDSTLSTGNLTAFGTTRLYSQIEAVRSFANAATDIDLSTHNIVRVNANSAKAFTFSNVPASGLFEAFMFTMELFIGSSGSVTFPASVKWPGGTAPTLAPNKFHILMFYTSNGGGTWYASSLQSY